MEDGIKFLPVEPDEFWNVACFFFHPTSTALSTMGTYSSYSEKPPARLALPINLAWTKENVLELNLSQYFAT